MLSEADKRADDCMSECMRECGDQYPREQAIAICLKKCGLSNRSSAGMAAMKSSLTGLMERLRPRAMNKSHLLHMALAVYRGAMTEDQAVAAGENQLVEWAQAYRAAHGGRLFESLDEIPDELWTHTQYSLSATGHIIGVRKASDGKRMVEFTATVEQQDNHGTTIDIEAFERAMESKGGYQGYMWAPVVTDGHTNRIIGLVREYEFSTKEGTDGKTHPSLRVTAEVRRGHMVADAFWAVIEKASKDPSGLKQLGASVGFDVREDAYFCESAGVCHKRITAIDLYEMALLHPEQEPSNPGSNDVQVVASRASPPTPSGSGGMTTTEKVSNTPDDTGKVAPSAEVAVAEPDWAKRIADQNEELLKLLRAREDAGAKGAAPAPAVGMTKDEVTALVRAAVSEEIAKLGLTRAHPSAAPHDVGEQFPSVDGEKRGKNAKGFADELKDAAAHQRK